ncbi:MAG: hypothetical protein HZB56_09470 [Deltaproteobacteria bacterium]|nr:hypothetical protein [Deltaproteobacteria bacterium]
MSPARPAPPGWTSLFAPGGAGPALALREVGLPRGAILVLPAGSAAARATLRLYPAQRPLARLAQALLAVAAPLGLGPGTRRALRLSPADPFVDFLCAAGADLASRSPLGIFAGRGDLQRFVLVLLDAEGRARGVVKAGLEERARAQVRRERDLLAALAGEPGVPALRGSFESEQVSALALDHLEGETLRACAPAELRALLLPWLRAGEWARLEELPQGQALRTVVAGSAAGRSALATLSGGRFHPALRHGDLAPWNLRRAGGAGPLVALDWEQGELRGLPGWDWLHCVVQTELLVVRAGAGRLARAVRGLLAAPDFAAYCERAGLAGRERALATLFLLALAAQAPEGGAREALLGAVGQLG